MHQQGAYKIQTDVYSILQKLRTEECMLSIQAVELCVKQQAAFAESAIMGQTESVMCLGQRHVSCASSPDPHARNMRTLSGTGRYHQLATLAYLMVRN
jgi:hypothetical protein